MTENLRNYAMALISPTAWIGIFLILGIILLWTKKQKIGRILFTLGVTLFVLFSFDPMVGILLNQLENKYPGFEVTQQKSNNKIKFVVVLGGGYIQGPANLPLSSKLGKSTNIRVIEGIKIFREIPGSKLVFTGRGWASITEAQAMKNFAISPGVKPEDIILENESTNTIDHTVYLKDILKTDQFVLVTSALHMPRSMDLFEKAGYSPIPAPTGHILTGQYGLFPTGNNLFASDLVFHEYASMILAKMKGKL